MPRYVINIDYHSNHYEWKSFHVLASGDCRNDPIFKGFIKHISMHTVNYGNSVTMLMHFHLSLV